METDLCDQLQRDIFSFLDRFGPHSKNDVVEHFLNDQNLFDNKTDTLSRKEAICKAIDGLLQSGNVIERDGFIGIDRG